MKTKELKIEIPENQEIDWQESAKQEKIVFKRIDDKPRSWEEYCKNHKGDFYYITGSSKISGLGYDPGENPLDVNTAKNVLPSRELAEAFLAMMQLMSLRQDWIHKWSIDNGMTDDWKPDWKTDTKKWCIISAYEIAVVDYFYSNSCPLSFPTEEMAKDFLNCFKDLLKIAKPLI